MQCKPSPIARHCLSPRTGDAPTSHIPLPNAGYLPHLGLCSRAGPSRGYSSYPGGSWTAVGGKNEREPGGGREVKQSMGWVRDHKAEKQKGCYLVHSIYLCQ